MNLIYGTRSDKVYVGYPHITSRASYILLRYQYEKILLEEWEIFRNKFFDTFDSLVCVYCGKKELLREIPDHTDSRMLGRLATVDHIVPLSAGGDRYSVSNCLVACHPCNRTKQSKVGDAFLDFVLSRIKHFGDVLGVSGVNRLRGLIS